jgi:Uma2 family endonuclease
LNPTVLIEVISLSTALYDRTQKFAHYRQIKSLREYVMIEQESPEIERYSVRDGIWFLKDFRGLDGALALESIDCSIPLAEHYSRVDFPPPSPPSFEPEVRGLRPGRPV